MPVKAQILVVDDDPQQREMLAGLLGDMGYRARSCANGKEALAHVEAGGVDVVLTDLRMPGLSGLDILKQARALNPRVDFVLLTAFGTIETAVDAIKSGAYDESAVGRSDRYGPHALTLLGDTLLDLNRGEEARRAYERALAGDPTSIRARMGLGYLHYTRGDLKEADQEFARAQSEAAKVDASNEAEPLFFRGVVAEERQRLESALHFYLKAIERDRELAPYRLALAALYERMEQPKKAVRAYKAAARMDRSDALPCLQAGLLLSEMRRGKAALEQLEEAIRRDRSLADAHLAAGTVHQDLLGRPKDAIRCYERYLEVGGNDPRVPGWIEELGG